MFGVLGLLATVYGLFFCQAAIRGTWEADEWMLALWGFILLAAAALMFWVASLWVRGRTREWYDIC